MAISLGEALPNAEFLRLGTEGVESVQLNDLLSGKKVALFAVPGAYTPTCSNTHVPSFVNNVSKLRDKGVDQIICVSVNDPFVLNKWAEETGASAAGVQILSDSAADFTKAVGLDFSFPAAGLHSRSTRYSMYVVDGIVKLLNREESPGTCGISSGDTLLDQIAD